MVWHLSLPWMMTSFCVPIKLRWPFFICKFSYYFPILSDLMTKHLVWSMKHWCGDVAGTEHVLCVDPVPGVPAADAGRQGVPRLAVRHQSPPGRTDTVSMTELDRLWIRKYSDFGNKSNGFIFFILFTTVWYFRKLCRCFLFQIKVGQAKTSPNLGQGK